MPPDAQLCIHEAFSVGPWPSRAAGTARTTRVGEISRLWLLKSPFRVVEMSSILPKIQHPADVESAF
jgi:hypothetical protein